MKRHVREILLLTSFLIIAFFIGISSSLLNKSQTRTTTAFAAEVDDSCREGVYYVKNPDDTNSEISCGRGVCGGVSYEGTASIDANRNGKCWWGSGSCGLACKGFVPLCCYKMAQTGDAKDCPFPERKYCRQDQCKQQTKNEDSNCGSGIKTYCVDIPNCLADRDDVPVLSLDDRLEGRKTPSNGGNIPTSTSVPQSTATPKPATPTATPVPNQQATATPRVNPTQGGGNNSQSGITIFPINSPIPTPTRRMSNNSDNSLDQPTSSPQTNNDSSDTTNNDSSDTTNNDSPDTTNNDNTDSVALPGLNAPELNFEMPKIAFKAPNQMLKESVTGESIEKLNRATEPPLMAAEKALVSIKSYDQQLENTVEEWIDYVRIQLTKLFQ